MLDVSVGIMAYNEAGNMSRILSALLSQQLKIVKLKEIIVIASGCTDSTADIVKELMAQDSRINLLVQKEREGKASAINLFLTKAAGSILVLESADTVPAPDCLERLVAPFENVRVGMTGAHPLPINERDTFIDFTVRLMWAMHHEIAQETPKLGEMVAFRNIVKEIPTTTAVDEACLEAILQDAGYELRYASDAVVRNKGPETIKDFIKQRRRIAAGHIHLMKEQKYEVSTFGLSKVLGALARTAPRSFREGIWTLGAILLEFIGRCLGSYDFYIRKKNPYIWDIAVSTKTWS
jgi:poly-beta-1,6-N-acetyl-D-glucosamine synthase